MSGDILDLIDGAIDAAESYIGARPEWPDAMRWTPTPATVAAFAAALDPPIELTPWQREVLAGLPDMPTLPPLRFDRVRLPPLQPERVAWVARLFDVPPDLLT